MTNDVSSRPLISEKLRGLFVVAVGRCDGEWGVHMEQHGGKALVFDFILGGIVLSSMMVVQTYYYLAWESWSWSGWCCWLLGLCSVLRVACCVGLRVASWCGVRNKYLFRYFNNF